MNEESATLPFDPRIPPDYAWLIDGPGGEWLEQVQDDRAPLHELSRRLRRHLTATQTQLLLEQRDLRARAGAKFPHSDKMFFTRRSLEQATDAVIAHYKASRFPEARLIVDACCGVGGDSLALAARSPIYAIDRDPLLVYLARANLRRVQNVHDHQVVCSELFSTTLPSNASLHIDPDRRPCERRSIRLEAHEPNDTQLFLLLRRYPDMAIKLAPATDPEHSMLGEAELEWIGHSGQCQQLVAWFGSLTSAVGRRTAVLVRPDGTHRWTAEKTIPLHITQRPDSYVYEPVPSILAAGLAGSLADRWGLQSITPGGGYLTGPQADLGPWAQAFEVLETVPYRLSKVRDWLSQRGIGRVEIKKRNVEVDPAAIQRQLSGSGEGTAVVMLTRLGPKIIAIIARRKSEEGGEHPG